MSIAYPTTTDTSSPSPIIDPPPPGITPPVITPYPENPPPGITPEDPLTNTTSPITTTTRPLTTTTPNVPSTTWRPTSTSSAVPIVTVSRSRNTVITYTSTSYSAYQTTVPTLVSNDANTSGSSSVNVGAIVGGVVGGIAGLAIIGLAFFFFRRRRRNSKNKKYNDDGDIGRNNSVNPQAYNEYNTYGSPTMVGTDANSPSTGRPLSMSTNTAGVLGAKPRPFVQAYNPDPSQQPQNHNYDSRDLSQQQYNNAGYDIQDPSQQYSTSGYDSQDPSQQYSTSGYDSHDPSQQYDNTSHGHSDPSQYYDYQNPQQQQQYGVSNNYNTTGYNTHDGYYAQAEPMMPNSTSNPTGLSKMDHNVPDEIDYPRHVPDEIDTAHPPTTHTK